LKRLAAVESLDRPAGLSALFETLSADKVPRCHRHPAEELMRSTICACGFTPDRPLPAISETDPEPLIENALTGYLTILRTPPIREAVSARIYALADADPSRAESLRGLMTVLQNDRLSAAGLLDVLDDTTANEIATALSGRMDIQQRNLKTLFADLTGRRLAPDQIMENVKAWIADADPKSIIAIDDDGDTRIDPSGPEATTWWPLLHPALFGDDIPPPASTAWEKRLARAYPARELLRRFKRLDTRTLIRFITTEPIHTEAIRVAWQQLCRKVLSVPSSFPENDPLVTAPVRHGNRGTTGETRHRLDTLSRWSRLETTDLPAALTGRIHLARIYSDSWATADIREQVLDRIDILERESGPWLDACPPLRPIDLTDAPLVVIFDGVSPDVWLAVLADLATGMAGSKTGWSRLETTADTASAVAALFGFNEDALDAFDTRRIPYHQVTGDEADPLADRLPAPVSGRPMVIRVGMIDKGAHAGTLRLEEMPGVVAGFLKKELSWLQEICREPARPLVLTTDHGLSFTARGLTHGSGDHHGRVFERTIFRTTF
jgi:hypothetical protein